MQLAATVCLRNKINLKRQEKGMLKKNKMNE